MNSPVELFGLATRGVNVVEAPTHLSKEEVTSAQNVEVVSDAGENALDQRPGMSKVNAAALNGSVVMAQDVPADVLLTKTPTLYVGLHSTATHNWRKSTDGTTWVNDDTPAKAYRDSGSAYMLTYGRAVTVKGKMYYAGGLNGAPPINIHQFDGTTDKAVTAIPPAVSGATLTLPVTPTVTFEGYSPASTTYTYKVVAKLGASTSAASTAASVTTGAASLNSGAYVGLDLGTPVFGASAYDIYRTVGGGTTGKIGSVPVVGGAFTTGNGSGLSGAPLATPAAPTVSGFSGTSGSTTYSYKVVPKFGSSNHGVASSAGSSAGNGATQGDGVTPGTVFFYFGSSSLGTPVAGATSYDVYRTAGGTTQGKIGNIPISGGAFSTGNGSTSSGVTNPIFGDAGLTGDGTTAPATGSGFSGTPASWHFTDGGLTGDAAVAPVAASGTSAGEALAVTGIITDGTSLYLSVMDMAGADPVVYGRVLKYTPGGNTWSQLGANFPSALGNGCPGQLAFYGGTLSYGTYAGVTAGNTTYLNNVGLPLPAGGVQETHTTAASQVATSMAVFNGDLYVGYYQFAAVAATLVKRVPIATWSTSLTAPSAGAGNGWTAMGVFNGLLFAGFTASGLAVARVYSTVDGVTWTLELTTGSNQVPGQMVVFNNKLYVSMVGFGTDSHTYQRDTVGTWTLVDTQTDFMTGATAVVYV